MRQGAQGTRECLTGFLSPFSFLVSFFYFSSSSSSCLVLSLQPARRGKEKLGFNTRQNVPNCISWSRPLEPLVARPGRDSEQNGKVYFVFLPAAFISFSLRLPVQFLPSFSLPRSFGSRRAPDGVHHKHAVYCVCIRVVMIRLGVASSAGSSAEPPFAAATWFGSFLLGSSSIIFPSS